MLSKRNIVCLYNLLFLLTLMSASKLSNIENNPTQIYLLGLNDAGKTAIFNSLLVETLHYLNQQSVLIWRK